MVTVDSGEFPLLRNIDCNHEVSISKVLNKWSWVFKYDIPNGLNALADVIEDVYTYQVWDRYRLKNAGEFFEWIGVTGLNLDNPARLIATLRGGDSDQVKKQIGVKLYEVRREKVQELKTQDPTLTQQEIADQVGVSQQRVAQIIQEKTVITEKTCKPKREIKGYRITSYTKPETAAQKIIDIFGEEFSRQLLEQIKILLTK
jgi:hypothetical protein